MAAQEILLLGNPKLYGASAPVEQDKINEMRSVSDDLFDTMGAFRQKHGWGRAIAAPQIGVLKRMVCMNVDREIVLINPELEMSGDEMMTVWDDCMSFPELLVKVRRYRRCRVRFRDLDWNDQVLDFEDDLAELIQHEVDHLDGILTIQRAVDERSIAMRSQRGLLG